MSNTSQPAPGWYPDPDRAGAQRWWDGNAWGPLAPTAATIPAPPMIHQSVGYSTAAFGRPEKRLGTAYLLGVFIIGSHRIYLGRIGSGIAMFALWYIPVFLLLFGVPMSLAWVPVAAMIAVFVWWVVDLARMRTLVDQANGSI
jgi:hypothetical protein